MVQLSYKKCTGYMLEELTQNLSDKYIVIPYSSVRKCVLWPLHWQVYIDGLEIHHDAFVTVQNSKLSGLCY